MKTIYILLTRTDTWVSRTIGLLTADPYTHASIAFNAELQPMYSFARYYPNLPLPAGLRIEPLHKGFFKQQSHVPCALYALEVTDEVYAAAQHEVDRMMLEAPRYQFSVIGLILCKLNIPFHRRHHYFCSEFVSEVLHRSKALTLPKDPSLMRPGDYTQIPALTCRYEGRLNQLGCYQRAQRRAARKEELWHERAVAV